MELALPILTVTVSCKSYLIRNTWKSSGVNNERLLDGRVRLNSRYVRLASGITGIQDRTTITYSLVFPWCSEKCAILTKETRIMEVF